eukprot:3802164-Amphidinium_carterae.1
MCSPSSKTAMTTPQLNLSFLCDGHEILSLCDPTSVVGLFAVHQVEATTLLLSASSHRRQSQWNKVKAASKPKQQRGSQKVDKMKFHNILSRRCFFRRGNMITVTKI